MGSPTSPKINWKLTAAYKKYVCFHIYIYIQIWSAIQGSKRVNTCRQSCFKWNSLKVVNWHAKLRVWTLHHAKGHKHANQLHGTPQSLVPGPLDAEKQCDGPVDQSNGKAVPAEAFVFVLILLFLISSFFSISFVFFVVFVFCWSPIALPQPSLPCRLKGA